MTTTTTTINGYEFRVQHVRGTVELALTERRVCSGCDKVITVSGPVRWLDKDGDVQGAHSHQHACGAWNTPHSALRRDAEPVPELLEEMAAEVLTERNERLAQERNEIRTRLTRELRDAIVNDADPGDGMEPGIYEDANGELAAWDYDPDPESDECITVRAAEIV